jgi:tryptophan-rich sensory protein
MDSVRLSLFHQGSFFSSSITTNANGFSGAYLFGLFIAGVIVAQGATVAHAKTSLPALKLARNKKGVVVTTTITGGGNVTTGNVFIGSVASIPKAMAGVVTSLPFALAVVHAVGGCVAVPIVNKAIRIWYRKINLPKWTPPDKVFGPVWTILYSCMGVAVARVIQRVPKGTVLAEHPAIALWIGHYVLNLLWAPVFFGLKRLRMGLMINGLLVGSLSVIIARFQAVDPVASYLLYPYMAWLIYATVLNWAICKRNPTRNGMNDAIFFDDLYKGKKKAPASFEI